MQRVSALSTLLQGTAAEAPRRSDYDVIVVGAGAAGGLAAMLLAGSGLQVLVLDAGLPRSRLRAPLRRLVGRLARTLSTPEGLGLLPPSFVPRAQAAARWLGRWRQPIQSRCMTWALSPTAFVDDRDCPYVTPPDRPFVWVRVRMLGGRLAVPGHGRQYYRLGPDDFRPRDELSPAWPLKPGELDPWYGLVERRLQLRGMLDHLPYLPDSELAYHLSFTEAEKDLRGRIVARWPGAHPVAGRHASPLETLEAAARTGRLRCLQGAVAREVIVDESGHACGVIWVDHRTGRQQRSSAPLVFLCASALESTRILMLSRSRGGAQGLGSASGALGNYLMDHILVSAEGIGRSRASAAGERSDRCLYLPRFDARNATAPNPGRGYGVQVYEFAGAGGRSHFAALSFAEMIPRWENRVTLDPNRRDAWGIPILRIDCAYDASQLARARDQTQGLRELAEVVEADLTRIDEVPAPPGSSYHECGTARMGTDPGNSVLDANNECWDARGLYVTDGACFPSQGSQNPTLTILALTARACQHALNSVDRSLVSQLRAAEREAPFTHLPPRAEPTDNSHEPEASTLRFSPVSKI